MTGRAVRKALLIGAAVAGALVAWCRVTARLDRLEDVTGAWRVADPDDCCPVFHVPGDGHLELCGPADAALDLGDVLQSLDDVDIDALWQSLHPERPDSA